MRRIAAAVTVSIACCLAAAASLSAHAAATGAPPCTPKKVTLQGKTVYDLCGPATATLKVGGRSYTFSKGYCQMRSGSLQLFLGTLAPMLKGNGGKPIFDLTAEHFGGTELSAGGTVSASSGGKQLVNGLTKVSGHFPAQGSFKALTTKATGTWNCHGVVVKAS